jgi:xylulokinase
VSFLGIDLGTSGCKAAAFSETGEQISFAYAEYDMVHSRPGWSELDPSVVWEAARGVIARAVQGAARDPVKALSVSSMGEATVPVSADRRIVGPSLLMNDSRGEEYVPLLADRVGAERLYEINGNILGIQYSLPKMLWLRDNRPDAWREAWRFLLWSGFVSFMLGAEPVADYGLANRTLLFDVDRRAWSAEIARAAGVGLEKMPDLVPAGARIGSVSGPMAAELGLPRGTPIVAGTHDQQANAVGCGVVAEGLGMCGMGTYLCLVPVFGRRRPARDMMPLGLSTEHHPADGLFVTFLYNQGGALLKWYRDTFARLDRDAARKTGADIYDELIRECPPGPSGVMVLPHFSLTGPPEFLADSSGVIAGLKLDTSRGDILKGVLEGAIFYLKGLVDSIDRVGIPMAELRAVGGGSRSDAWLKITADILGRPLVRARVTEAGCLGAAIMAACGTGAFASLEHAVEAMVALGDRFDPDSGSRRLYAERYERWRGMWPLMKGWL